VDLSYLEQLAEGGQTEAVARIIGEFVAAGRSRSVGGIVGDALARIEGEGLDALGGHRGHPGELSLPRAQEIAAAVNRVRSLQASPGRI
jgi:hypothetical protein